MGRENGRRGRGRAEGRKEKGHSLQAKQTTEDSVQWRRRLCSSSVYWMREEGWDFFQ